MYPYLNNQQLWYSLVKNNWNNQGYTWNPYNYNWNPYYRHLELRDYGPNPFVVNIDEAARRNIAYRTALWTGKNMQVTLMSIKVGEDIGLEVHPNTDQFIRIEQGQGLVQMGEAKNKLDYVTEAYDDFAIMIPAGKWHNVTNTGNIPLKIYVIYAPPEHPFGTVHETKALAMAADIEETQGLNP